MQTPFPDQSATATLFSRERRRRRLRQFLENFERQAGPRAADYNFAAPLAKHDLRGPSLAASGEPHR